MNSLGHTDTQSQSHRTYAAASIPIITLGLALPLSSPVVICWQSVKDSKFHFPSGGNFLTELGVTPIFKTYMNKPHHKGVTGEHGSMACIEVMRKEEVMTGQESHTQIDCQKARTGTENMKTREHTAICLNIDDFPGYSILGKANTL